MAHIKPIYLDLYPFCFLLFRLLFLFFSSLFGRKTFFSTSARVWMESKRLICMAFKLRCFSMLFEGILVDDCLIEAILILCSWFTNAREQNNSCKKGCIQCTWVASTMNVLKMNIYTNQSSQLELTGHLLAAWFKTQSIQIVFHIFFHVCWFWLSWTHCFIIQCLVK